MKNKGITLIALVITIVVLIILAAVAVNLSLGNNGIFNRAKTAKEQYQNAQNYEGNEANTIGERIDDHVKNNRGYVSSDQIVLPMDVSKAVSTSLSVGSRYTFTADKSGYYNFGGSVGATGKGFLIYLYNESGQLLYGGGNSSAERYREINSGFIYLTAETKVDYMISNVDSAYVIYCPPLENIE